MGKGSGSCGRTALVLGGAVAPTAAHATVSREVPDLADCTDAASRALRLAQARHDAGWVVDMKTAPQPSWDELDQELLKYPGEVRALFYHDSLLDDGACYYEYAPPSLDDQLVYSDSLTRWISYFAETENAEFNRAVDVLDLYSKRKLRSRLNYYKDNVGNITDGELTDEIIQADLTRWCESNLTISSGMHTAPDKKIVLDYVVSQISVQALGDQAPRAEAAVSVDREEVLIEQMIQAGATVQAHDIPGKFLGSLDAGRRLSLRLDDGTEVSYIPHYSVGTEQGETVIIDGEFKVTTERLQAAVSNASDAPAYDRAQFVRIKGNLFSPEDLEDLSEEELQTRVVEKPAMLGGWYPVEPGDTLPIPDDTDLQDEDYRRHSDGRWYSIEAGSSDAEPRYLSEAVGISYPLGKITLPAPATEEQQRQAIHERASQTFNNLINVETDYPSFPNNSPDYETRGWFADHEDLTPFTITSAQTVVGREIIKQTAPLSERGRLIVTGANPTRAEAALRDLGAIGQQVAQVPYEEIYHSPNHRGKVTAWHDDYASGKQALPQSSEPIVHGMTGCRPDSVMARFKRIGQSGGLRSIAERRRSGINVSSMSPIGDIASGIDNGVPFTVSKSIVHGEYIRFLAKPTVLARRDIWFAPTDYGECNGRWDSFNTYARSLGQDNIHTPPSHQARRKHLKACNSQENNEVYFKHQIALHDIGGLIVDDQYYEEVSAEVTRWKEEGLIDEVPVLLKSDDVTIATAWDSVKRKFAPRRRTRRKKPTAS